MVDKNWLKKNTEKLDKIESNKDKGMRYQLKHFMGLHSIMRR